MYLQTVSGHVRNLLPQLKSVTFKTMTDNSDHNAKYYTGNDRIYKFHIDMCNNYFSNNMIFMYFFIFSCLLYSRFLALSFSCNLSMHFRLLLSSSNFIIAVFIEIF